jgi:hypothetical protein
MMLVGKHQTQKDNHIRIRRGGDRNFMKIQIKNYGNFNKTEGFLSRALRIDYLKILDNYGREGVAALAKATPVDSGLTASSWEYKITKSNTSLSIAWTNSHIVDGVPIAIILQYGHGTKNGGYVQGRDYINPAIQLIFDKIANDAWGEVIKV